MATIPEVLCKLCGKSHDQMLMLACVHDPCIECAVASYAEQIHIKGLRPEEYKCDICGELTSLDASTIAALKDLSKKHIRLPSQVSRASTSPMRKEPIARSLSPPEKSSYFCKTHPEDELTYFCSSCVACICPQCVIHGAHKDHDVKKVHLAVGAVKNDFQSLLTRATESNNRLANYKEGLQKTIKDCSDIATRQKTAIARQFQKMRAVLNQRQRELMKETDQNSKANMGKVSQLVDSLSTKQEEVNKNKRTLEGILRKDDIALLEEYRGLELVAGVLESLKIEAERLSTETLRYQTQTLEQGVNEAIQSLKKLKLQIARTPVSVQPNRL